LLVLLGLILLLVLPYLAQQIQYGMTRGKLQAEMEAAGNALEKMPEAPNRYRLAAMRVSPSVVGIKTVQLVNRRGYGDEWWDEQPSRALAGEGSGVIVDPDGYIVTNYHVISQASQASVQLADWPVCEAQWDDTALAGKMAHVLAIRDVVNAAIQDARTKKVISQPIAAKVLLYSAGETRALLESLEDTLAMYLIVSQAQVKDLEHAPASAYRGALPQLAVDIAQAPGAQCPRCRLWRTTIGRDTAYPTLCADCAVTLQTARS
jgi:hypothetical protein